MTDERLPDISDLYTEDSSPSDGTRERLHELLLALDVARHQAAEVADEIAGAVPPELLTRKQELAEREAQIREGLRACVLETHPGGGAKVLSADCTVTVTKTTPKYAAKPECVRDPAVLQQLRRAEGVLERNLVVYTIDTRYIDECFRRNLLSLDELVAAGALEVKQVTPQVRITARKR
jgi:hypothetical protein